MRQALAVVAPPLFLAYQDPRERPLEPSEHPPNLEGKKRLGCCKPRLANVSRMRRALGVGFQRYLRVVHHVDIALTPAQPSHMMTLAGARVPSAQGHVFHGPPWGT